MNRNPSQLEAAVEAHETRAEWGAWAVMAGLILEIGLALAATYKIGNENVEHWGTVFSTMLIALGVYAEIHFGRKASNTHNELRRLSDERVAEVNAAAASAIERAAILEKAAADARERTAEIERMTMPRRISPEQRDVVTNAIRGKAPDRVLIQYHSFDIEAAVYSLELYKLFLGGRRNIR